MVKLIAVTLSAVKGNGRETEIVQHKDGIVLFDDNGKEKEGRWVNVTSGERSGTKRPFVVIHLEERNVEASGGGNTSKDPYFGTFRPDGGINWNNKIHPREFQEALKAGNNQPVSMNQVGTVLDEFVGEKRAKFLAMDAWDFMLTAKEFDLKMKSVGKFMSLPSEDEPLLKGIGIRPYEINGRMASNYTTFIYTPTIKAGREAILRSFVDANQELVITATNDKGEIISVMDNAIREKEREERQVAPEIIAARQLVETLSLPSAEEKTLQGEYDSTYDAIQNLDGEFAKLDPKDITADMKKSREELGKKAADLKVKKDGVKVKRLDELAVAKAKL